MASPDSLLEAANRLAQALAPADLDDTLAAVTGAAVEVLPQVDYASITVRLGDGALETRAETSPMLVELDAEQYALREGPCYHAATDAPVVVSWNLAMDDRFPNYGPLAVERGVLSQAGLRLFTGKRRQGALNLYSTKPAAFEDFDQLGALFATQAATAIGYAIEVGNLREAMQTRTTIGQAVGIVMERYGLGGDHAFAFLTRLSQHRNVKLRLIAEQIVAGGAVEGDG